MRVNVYVPDDLGEQLKSTLPDLNVSAVVQSALRDLLDCDHPDTVCGDCGEPVDPVAVAGEALAAFWRELLWAWEPLVDRGGTAVGAAQVAKGVAVELGVPMAERMPLPRPARRRAS